MPSCIDLSMYIQIFYSVVKRRKGLSNDEIALIWYEIPSYEEKVIDDSDVDDPDYVEEVHDIMEADDDDNVNEDVVRNEKDTNSNVPGPSETDFVPQKWSKNYPTINDDEFTWHTGPKATRGLFFEGDLHFEDWMAAEDIISQFQNSSFQKPIDALSAGLKQFAYINVPFEATRGLFQNRLHHFDPTPELSTSPPSFRILPAGGILIPYVSGNRSDTKRFLGGIGFQT
ncbi:hypothetical protein AVEN_239384-1 [Araneus ventricosus]|uniref:Uncharacterized protein n=1 Tax=Araneus ventricosus TaxID=182803 RepID=A0A4Y2EBD1_ARAVE|nr:hypothetical protein AVEN_239384-1 [Araneus ventricosus]